MSQTSYTGLPNSGGRPCIRKLSTDHIHLVSDDTAILVDVLRTALKFRRDKAKLEASLVKDKTIHGGQGDARKDVDPDPFDHPFQCKCGLKTLKLRHTHGKTPFPLSGQSDQHGEGAIQQEEVLDIIRRKKTQDFELNPFTLDVHNVEGMVAGLEKLPQWNARRPWVMGHEWAQGRLANVELNSKVRGDFLQGAQRIHTVRHNLHW